MSVSVGVSAFGATSLLYLLTPEADALPVSVRRCVGS